MNVQERAEMYRRQGLSERAALVAARGRGYTPEDPYDAAVLRFRRLGMSESAAKRAVRGREHRSDADAARALREAHAPQPPRAPQGGSQAPSGTRVPLAESVGSAGRTAPLKLSESPCCGVTPATNPQGVCPKCKRPVAAG